jgi:uncharacterized protein YecT (DUF1311 family)
MTQYLKVLIFMFAALAAIATRAENQQLVECEKMDGHADSRACLEKLSSSLSDQLQDTEKRAVGSLLTWKEDETYKSSSIKAFLESIVAFRKYQTEQCDFTWSLAAGENGAGDMRLSCEIELSEQRIKQIAEYVSRKDFEHASQANENSCPDKLVYGKRNGEIFPLIVSPLWNDREILKTLGLNISRAKVKTEFNSDGNSVEYKFKQGVVIIAHSEVNGMLVTYAEHRIDHPTIEFEIPDCESQ